MHLKRLGIALIVVPLFFLYVTKLSPVFFLSFLVVISAIAQYEFYSICRIKGILRYSGIAFGMLTLVVLFLSKNHMADLLAAGFIAISGLRLFSKRDPASSLNEVASVIIAVIYIPGLFGYQVYLREYGADWIIFLYGCVWASDSLAYYIGKGIGKRKLYAEMSPNKTIEGAFGSVAGGALGAVIVKSFLIRSIVLPMKEAIILGIIIGAVTIIGDLVESMFKRDAGIKDSSRILPGHGGFLDKADSVLFAGPALYWASAFLGLTR